MCLVTNYGTRGYELDVRCVVKVARFCNVYSVIIPNQITMYNSRLHALVYLLAVAYEDVFF